MDTTENDSFVGEGMDPPTRILFPPEKILMAWQQSQGAGAGIFNVGNTCFLNSVLQCLTYTPPLANYLLSQEHSKTCDQQGSCMMCAMETHVNKALRSAVSAILPLAVLKVFKCIGDHFQLGREEDAHDFFSCTVNAMQRACLGENSNLDLSSQSTTVVSQIFGGFLRSRLTCFSCDTVSDSYEAFLDIPLDIKAASSLMGALEDFVAPEILEGENSYKCSICNDHVMAAKRFTIHCAPKILTVCLKRFDCFTGDKIRKAVDYPEYLDLRPYMSQAEGEPLRYSLYSVLVHTGVTCQEGHYFCYTKASNGLWYRMDDENVQLRCLDTALKQQAYLLFYARCADPKTGEQASSSSAPACASSFVPQWADSTKQVASDGPQSVPCSTEAVLLDVEGSGRERAQSRSRLRGRKRRGHGGDTKSSGRSAAKRRTPPSGAPAAKDAAAPRPAKRSLQCAAGPEAAQEEAPVGPSDKGGYNLRSRFVQHTDYEPAAKKKKKLEIAQPDQTPAHCAVPEPSSSCVNEAPVLRGDLHSGTGASGMHSPAAIGEQEMRV